MCIRDRNKIKEYARLYFRPRTPTQYHNEGYKPEHIRDTDVNANCPVPIFFFLDSNTILNMDGVEFSETSCAGQHDLQLLSGTEEFESLQFYKIYHDKYILPDERDDIVKHRHAEVVRLNGLPIKDTIKGIVCRSVAEKQTLLYLLKTQYPKAYRTYQPIIRYSPELNLFFNNGIFVKTVEYSDGKIFVELNDKSKRYHRDRSNENDFEFKADVQYIDENGIIIEREQFILSIDYASVTGVNLSDVSAKSNNAIVEIYFDNNLMYKNILNMSTEDLL